MAVAAGSYHTVGLRSDGTVVATEYTGARIDYHGQCEVSGWKLFNSFETIEAERKATAERAEAEQKAAEEKREAERKAAIERNATAEKAEAERRLKAEKSESLIKERNRLLVEKAKLTGLFTGRRRREIEERLAQIDAELKKLR